MITLDEFLKKYLGGSWGYPDNNLYRGECLSVCKLYIKECFGINPPASGTNSAYGYWSNFPSPLGTVFEKVENTDTLIPEKGWIVIWKPWDTNKYGHIAIVADGCTTGTLKNYAQNWTSKIFQLESNRYTNVVGFLKPKVISSDENMTEEEKRILQFLSEQGANEGKVREAFGALADLPKLNKENLTLKSLSENLASKVKELAEQLAEEQRSGAIWQKEISSAKKQVQKLEGEMTTLAKEKNQYKNWYEAKCAELKVIDKMTALEHITYGLKLLVQKQK